MSLNNSSLANETFQRTPGPRALAFTKITLYSVLLVWSLLGNVLVIAVVYCNRTLRTNMNYLIVNMAVSDLIIPLVALPRMISSVKVRPDEWLVAGPLGDALCKLVPFLSHISPIVSSISLVFIAFQRFVAVVYPSRRQILTPKTKYILITFPWVIAMAIVSPEFYIFRLTKERDYTMCKRSWSPAFDPVTADVLFISILTTTGFVIPLVAIIILYTIIHYELRKSLKNVMELIQREIIRSRQQRNRKIINMAITIIVLFTIGWFPYSTIYLLYTLKYPALMSMDHDTFIEIFFVFFSLWNFLPAISPCIYFLFLKDFRRGLKRICCRQTTLRQQLSPLCVCCVSSVAAGGDSNQDPTCKPPHINTTSV